MNADTVAVVTSKKFFESLATRFVTAVVLLCTALAALEVGGLFFGLVSLSITAILCFEWIRMTCKRQYLLILCISILIVGITYSVLAVYGIEIALWVSAFGILSISLTAARKQKRMLWVSAGILIFILTMLSINWIRNLSPNGLQTMYWVFSVVWATDIGAYIFGNLFKGPLLAPRISPAKTWSGAIMGIVSGSCVGTLILYLFFDFELITLHLGWGSALIAGLLLSVLSQLGDLLESKVKRYFNVKDSGSWLPGHGGVLDRLDSIILVVPILALVIFIIGQKII